MTMRGNFEWNISAANTFQRDINWSTEFFGPFSIFFLQPDIRNYLDALDQWHHQEQSVTESARVYDPGVDLKYIWIYWQSLTSS